jgi:hypothetical protein
MDQLPTALEKSLLKTGSEVYAWLTNCGAFPVIFYGFTVDECYLAMMFHMQARTAYKNSQYEI